MQIGILQTGRAPDALVGTTGDYPAMFARLLDGYGFTFRTWAVVDMDFPKGVHDADGWLITGSRHGAYEDHPFIKPLEAFIRDAYAAHVPMVGICFGHQIIAQALGGRVEKFSGGWSVGPTVYDFEGEAVTLNAWHQDQVTALPPGARIVARGPMCDYAALAYDDRALTIQAHPEFSRDFIEGLMQTRGRGLVPEDRLAAASERRGRPLSDQAVADRIAAFFKQPRAGADAGV
ncbi:MAG: type 1 glutamine amidotransferase [Gemmobacter sp.]